MGLFSSCKDCKDRYRGCHDVCEKYLEAKKKHNELHKNIKRVEEINRINHRREGN